MLGNNILQMALMAGLSGMGRGAPGTAIPGAKPTVMENGPPPTSPGVNDYGAPPSLPVAPQMGMPIPQIQPPGPAMLGGPFGPRSSINPMLQGLFGGRGAF